MTLFVYLRSTNYRPVAIFPSFSKFLEKVVYSRLYNPLSKLKILCDNQFGFRKNHSTSLSLIDPYGKISLALHRYENAIGVFLDLSKAFDTVDYYTLNVWSRGKQLVLFSRES